MRPPINWFGGKARLSKWLVTLIPEHTTYVEVFGGSGALLFAKEPSHGEIYNDIDDGLVNLYRVLRDPEQFAQLETMLRLTLYSRSEFDIARESFTDSDPIRRAWAMFVCARMGRGSVQAKIRSSDWRFARTAAPAVLPFHNAVTALGAIHARLKNVCVESADWRRIITRYDAPETFFYFDPPYLQSTRTGRAYHHDWDEATHVEFLATVATIRGKAAISGYDSALYASGLRNWRRETHRGYRTLAQNDGDDDPLEIVWCNYV